MYVVIRQEIIKFLSKKICRFPITYDGWKNNSLVGFFPVTLHWVDQEKGKPISMLLDFLHVAPGDGVGLRCGEALFKRLRSFDISSRLMCTIADGASDAIVASKELSRLLHEFHGCNILPSSHILRCMVHTFQLATKAALDVMCPTTMKLRKTLKLIRKCKTHRALFKRYSRTMFDKGEREPPCMDAVTRWNSTLVMYQQAIQLKDVINWTITECSVPTNVNEYLLTREEWTHVEGMIEWLAMPAKISKFFSGSKYTTLSSAGSIQPFPRSLQQLCGNGYYSFSKYVKCGNT